MSILVYILITIVLSAMFSGLEIAFVSSNKLKIELARNKGKLSAKILSILNSNSSNFIAMLLMGNNIALVIYGIYMAELLDKPINSILPEQLNTSFTHLLIETIVATIIILIFAEFLPKALFRLKSNKILNFFSYILIILYYLSYPFVFAFIKFSEVIIKVFFKTNVKQEKYHFSSADLSNLVEEYKNEEGEEAEDEKLKIFQNALNFQEVILRECLVPRTEVKALPIESKIEDLINLFMDSGHSKIPIYENDIDNIIGYIHAFDVFKKPESIKEIIRDIEFFPETMQAKVLLHQMIDNNMSIAVVLDEFGGTEGIVTLEDLIEEIFGDIEDEFDDDETIYEEIEENTFMFSARLEIDHLNEKYNLDIPVSENYETLAGYILNSYENIPDKGEIINLDNFKITIIESSLTKIELLKLEIVDA